MLLQQEAREKKYEEIDEKALIAQDRSKGKGKGKHGKDKPKKEKSNEKVNSSEEDNKKREKEWKSFYYNQPGPFTKDCRKKMADQKKGASSKLEETEATHVVEELFMASPSVNEVDMQVLVLQ